MHGDILTDPQFRHEEPTMQKKSLISTLKTTKKANVAAAPAKKESESVRKSVASMKSYRFKKARMD